MMAKIHAKLTCIHKKNADTRKKKFLPMILLTFNLELKMRGSPKAQSGCLLINLKAMIHTHRSQSKIREIPST